MIFREAMTKIQFVPLPSGVVSLTHESNLANWQAASFDIGEVFAATFIHSRQDMRDDQVEAGEDADDRIIMFQHPILVSGYIKSKDMVDVYLLGYHLLGEDREMFDSCKYDSSMIWHGAHPVKGYASHRRSLEDKEEQDALHALRRRLDEDAGVSNALAAGIVCSRSHACVCVRVRARRSCSQAICCCTRRRRRIPRR